MDDRKIIEEKDAALLESVRNIIQEKENHKSRKVKKNKILIFLSLIGCGVVFLIFMNVFSGKEQHFSNTSAPDIIKTEKSLIARIENNNSKHKQSDRHLTSRDDADEIQKEKTLPQNLMPSEVSSLSSTIPFDNNPIHDRAEIPETAKPVIKEKTFKKETVQKAPKSHLMWISKSVVCESVQNRQPLRDKTIFSYKNDKFVTVWTDVRAKKIPAKVHHVYYLENVKHCKVTLPVDFPRTRTWSRLRLNSRERIGNYRVDILADNGGLLQQITFKVLP